MIRTLLRIRWLNLKRDRVALGLTFVLPILFFSIFALVFGRAAGGGGGPGAIDVILVDEDGSELSRRFAEAIGEQSALRVDRAPGATEGDPEPAAFTRDTARLDVRSGRHDAAIVVPEGFGASFGTFGGETVEVELIHDAANPIAAPTIAGLLQAAAMSAAPDVLMERGLARLETFGEPLTPKQRAAVDAVLPALRGSLGRTGQAGGESVSAPTGFAGLVAVKATEARSADERSAGEEAKLSMVAYYAAGIGVMFLLFSMAGAGGALLEEEESGTLERVLSSRVGMGALLIGNWLFFATVGMAQVTIMFLWGSAVFGLELFTPKHLAGFATMTLVTAAAAAAFGILLATSCRSRAQLSGLSTILILVMSALGGSMMPKFLAKDLFAITSPFTLNGWALDGYLKVFWHDDPDAGLLASLWSLWPQVLVLALLTVVLLGAARAVARRWEAT